MALRKKDSVFLKKIFRLSFVFRVLMILSFFIALWKKDYVWVFGTLFVLFISFLPTIFKQNIKITLPWFFDFLITFLLVLHVGGRLLDYYITIPGYRLITRFLLSSLVALSGFILIYILDVYWDGLKMNKYAMAFAVVISTMSIGVIFEFIRWLNITGTYYIRTNQVLMLNLTTDTIAGIIVSIVGVYLIKSGEFDRMTMKMGKQINDSFIKKKRII